MRPIGRIGPIGPIGLTRLTGQTRTLLNACGISRTATRRKESRSMKGPRRSAPCEHSGGGHVDISEGCHWILDGGQSMSTSLLYHGFGIWGYQYVRTPFASRFRTRPRSASQIAESLSRPLSMTSAASVGIRRLKPVQRTLVVCRLGRGLSQAAALDWEAN